MNCKASGTPGNPELIHGLWYRYCTECGVYHALKADPAAVPRPKALVIPFRKAGRTVPVAAA